MLTNFGECLLTHLTGSAVAMSSIALQGARALGRGARLASAAGAGLAASGRTRAFSTGLRASPQRSGLQAMPRRVLRALQRAACLLQAVASEDEGPLTR